MPTVIPLIVHERRNVWGRHFRPRAGALGVRLIETRNAADLLRAVAGSPAPVILVTLGSRPAETLDLVDCALQRVPDALVVVLDPTGDPAVDRLARQFGVVEVLPVNVRPPVLLERIKRCAGVAAERAARSGWVESTDSDRDPIDALVRMAGA